MTQSSSVTQPSAGPAEMTTTQHQLDQLVSSGTQPSAGPAAPWARRAWWLLVATIPAFLVGVVIGEGLQAAFGYADAGPDATPWWVKLAAGGLGSLVMIAPPAVGVACAKRGRRLGEGKPARSALIGNGAVLTLLTLQLMIQASASFMA